MASAVDLEAALRQLVDTVNELVGADRGAVFINDPLTDRRTVFEGGPGRNESRDSDPQRQWRGRLVLYK